MSKPNFGQAPAPRALILASGSAYRRDLLTRLGVPFETLPPEVDETARPGESPAALARRLADEKCAAVASLRPGAVVIASDQLACRGNAVLGKPLTVANAEAQLRACSGAEVAFLTAVAIRVAADDTPRRHLDLTRVVFRHLTQSEIERYVKTEMPLDCAGSFKCEGLGISLFERILSVDPTALTGLPLIWTAAQLRAAGFALP